MSRAEQLLSQYQFKIDQVGQWVAIRRYTGTTVKSYTDTLTRGYVKYQPVTEFVGAIMQIDIVAIVLVDSLADLLPMSPSDKLVLEFSGYDDASVPPALDDVGHVRGKEYAIKSALKRTPGGTLIALELHAAG